MYPVETAARGSQLPLNARSSKSHRADGRARAMKFNNGLVSVLQTSPINSSDKANHRGDRERARRKRSPSNRGGYGYGQTQI